MVEILRGYIGLGSNLGDRLGELQAAAQRMSRAPGLALTRASSVYESPAQGFISVHMFLNAALEVTWAGEPLELASVLLAIEEQGGRARAEPSALQPGEQRIYEDRTIDLDILWLAGVDSYEPRLLLPHPRAFERAFVLLPWAELAPGLVLRGTKLGEWMRRLPLAELETTRRVGGPEWFVPG